MTPINALLIIFAFAELAQPLLALNPETRNSQYGHTDWHIRDVALNGNPTAFAQTPDGYIWVGTQSGLYRFDGNGFSILEPAARPKVSSRKLQHLLALCRQGRKPMDRYRGRTRTLDKRRVH